MRHKTLMDKYLGDYDNQKGVLVSIIFEHLYSFFIVAKCFVQLTSRIKCSETGPEAVRLGLHKDGVRNR